MVRDPIGFPDSCIALPPGADDATLAALCREHTARLLAWIEEQKKAQAEEDPSFARVPRYDGTVYGACQIYQRHPHSRFHKVKHNTRSSYVDSLKVIEATVGRRLIRNLTVLDVQHWYDEWRKPARAGGPERVDRAHNATAMFRTVLHFCAALRHDDCKRLAGELREARSLVLFERGRAREEELSYAQTVAFIRKALELGAEGVVPLVRARYLAIGIAAQFELMLRPMDVRGEIAPSRRDAEISARAARIEAIPVGAKWWIGFFTWERLAGWRWRMRTSKSKYRAPVEFDLTNYPLLLPLLEAVPRAERVGPVIKGDDGLPMGRHAYAKWFRRIARAAGIPENVWGMDARAGAATEAEEAEADLDAIRQAMTHSKEETTLRYIRRRSKKLVVVAQARNRKRAADETGGGTG